MNYFDAATHDPAPSSGSWLVNFDDLMVSQPGLPDAGGIKAIRRLKEPSD